MSNANVNCADRWNGTPLVDAIREGHVKAARLLREKGGELLWDEARASGELCELARAGDLERVSLLLECGCQVNAADCERIGANRIHKCRRFAHARGGCALSHHATPHVFMRR